jgi:hypothetical protein
MFNGINTLLDEYYTDTFVPYVSHNTYVTNYYFVTVNYYVTEYPSGVLYCLSLLYRLSPLTGSRDSFVLPDSFVPFVMFDSPSVSCTHLTFPPVTCVWCPFSLKRYHPSAIKRSAQDQRIETITALRRMTIPEATGHRRALGTGSERVSSTNSTGLVQRVRAGRVTRTNTHSSDYFGWVFHCPIWL